jgi:murein DD-endopeptidase MepM/ murein hydrolase activator NlpD
MLALLWLFSLSLISPAPSPASWAHAQLAVGVEPPPQKAAHFVPPLTGRVTRRFDPPPAPWLAGHRGVDLAAAPGAAVNAAGAGRVVFSGVVAGRGVVSVAHGGGLRTTYEPVTSSVAVGDLVAAGEPLGSLAAGHPGCPEPACLHWGLRRGSVYLDPLLLLGGGQVRLKPL